MHELSGDFFKQLGDLIQAHRKQKSLTQEAVADALGISRATLANLEAGEHRLLLHHALELAMLLDLDLNAIAALYNQTKLKNQIASTPHQFQEVLKRLQSSTLEARLYEASI